MCICVYTIVCAPVSVWKCVAMRHPVAIFHGLLLKQGQCNTIQYRVIYNKKPALFRERVFVIPC